MSLLNKDLQNRLEEKLKKLDELRPLPKASIEKLREKFRVEMTYNSNAIEGNSLTLKETFQVINEGITVKGKPLKDHLEAKNHDHALSYLYEIVDKNKRSTLSENLIRNINSLIMEETDKEWAGKYRNSNVIIAGADHDPPDALEVPKRMQEMIDWYRDNQKKLHVVELSALLHHYLVYIHPFFDGNGRTARLIMNLLLMKAGYPIVIILKNDRKKYYDVLSKADNKKFESLVRFVAQATERSLDMYLEVLTPTPFKREEYLPLSVIAKKTPYSAKYLNLLIRKGKLEAHKKGRIWLTSKEAVDRYISGRKRKR
jgi:Fic family protein